MPFFSSKINFWWSMDEVLECDHLSENFHLSSSGTSIMMTLVVFVFLGTELWEGKTRNKTSDNIAVQNEQHS